MSDKIFNYEKWKGKLADLSEKYQNAEEFPHIAIDDFIEKKPIDDALASFPEMKSNNWNNYMHFNEKKLGMSKAELIPENLMKIINELSSPEFIKFLEELTGIKNIIADPALEGGGIHQIPQGGFLNIHADFTVHPRHRNWRRRINVLVYLNKDWKDEYGGKLELWTKDMKRSFSKILPQFNRVVVFNTDKDSFHGHPDPLTCPDGMSRKSIALYYYTDEENPYKSPTNYKGRPDDGIKKLFIYLDKKAILLYNTLKGLFGISDEFTGKILKIFRKD